MSFHNENGGGLSLEIIAHFGAEIPIMTYKNSTAQTRIIFPDENHKGERIYKIRFDPREKSKNRPYQLQFYAAYKSRVDPKGLVKGLGKRKTYPSIDECHEAAKVIVDSLTEHGSSLSSIAPNDQTRLLQLTIKLQEQGIDAEQLLYDCTKMKELGYDPVKALETGRTLVTKAKNYEGKTLGDFITLYEKDPIKKRLKTHQNIVTTLKALTFLSEIKIETLVSADKTIEALTKVYRSYVNKPTITKESALDAQRSRVSQLLAYTRQKTNLPTTEVHEIVCHKDSYQDADLYGDLEGPNPIYSFGASEVLVLLKFFSQEDTFNPIWIIAATLMGQRQATINELHWKRIYPSPPDDQRPWNITIPKELTKLGRQRRLTQDIVFSTDAVPNLRQWILWARSLYKQEPNPDDKLHAIDQHWLRWEIMNTCINDYQDHFHFQEDSLKENASYTYGNLCKNGMRNTWFTMGLEHQEVEKQCCKIGNDFKSVDDYKDTSRPDAAKQAEILFSMTPSWLPLVDLDNGTVDKEFIEATLKEKKDLFEASQDSTKREIYRVIIREQDNEWFGIHEEDLFDDMMNPSHG